MEVVTAVRHQARACDELGSPMYGALLARTADDLEHGGVLAEALAGHEDDPGPSALGLRLLGSVHRLVLSGRAPRLAAFYPSVGGSWEPSGGWQAFTDTVREHLDEVRARLPQPPQTNEVGRAAALMGGVLHVLAGAPLPVRLFEIGASAGLNLRFDHFCYVDDRGRHRGRRDSPVRLSPAWTGRAVPAGAEPEVVERLGSDVSPVDATTPGGRLTLMSYVWPDQTERFARLRAALDVAADVPAPVLRQDAGSFVSALRLADGSATVLWHSVMWQYLDRAEQRSVTARVEELGSTATTRRVFAHLMLEPMRRTPGSERDFLVAARVWPGGGRRILGTAAPHGLPTVWE